jgi:outer membrane protein OmpA-like peptidoglycan-associated protein
VDESVIMFTSNRKGTGGDNNMTPEGDYFEDIWVCYRKPDGSWTQARSIGPTINTFDNEATIGLSADAQQLFIYKDDNGDGNIYVSELNGDMWSGPEKLGEDNGSVKTDINTSAWEPSACITADGNTIYFVSDRVGGFGGTDIYRVVRLPNGSWSMAQNLGPTINTMYDEDAPFIHPDGKTLFFSSKGQKTMGGYDIFYSQRFDSGWSAPRNVGYPINTADDDIFYALSADGKRAYYSSVRPGGLGDKDLYCVNLEDPMTGSVVVLKGKITFNGGDSLPPGVNIRIRDGDSGEELPDVKPNSKTGRYILVLTPGSQPVKNFVVTYEADSLDPIVENVKVERREAYSETEKSINIKDVDFRTKRLGTMSVSGTVRGSDGVVPEARINISDNANGALLNTYVLKGDGLYSFVIERGKNYNISFEADGYLFQSININVPKKAEYSEMKKDVVLDKIKVGVKITLNNIFFDSGKSQLRKESAVEMEKVILLLKQHPELRIEVSGHTDNKGNDQVNLRLSKDRAQSVVNYLIAHGVDKKRLVAVGYGKSQPVAPNEVDGKPNAEGMQLNRRVEMKIIK